MLAFLHSLGIEGLQKRPGGMTFVSAGRGHLEAAAYITGDWNLGLPGPYFLPGGAAHHIKDSAEDTGIGAKL